MFFAKWLQYLGVCLVVQDDIYDEKIIKRSISVFFTGAALTVLSGLSQYFFGVEFLRHKEMTAMSSGGKSAVTSSFAHYNMFGAYLAVVLSMAAAYLLKNRAFSFKTAALSALSILSTVAIVLTFSRGSWVAVLASFIFICAVTRRSFSRKNFIWLVPLFLAAIVMFSNSLFQERLFYTFMTQGDNDRFKLWVGALKMIKEQPLLGTGVGTFMKNFSRYLPGKPLYAHNCYLQIWAETGIFSLASFIFFAASVVYLGVKKFIASRDSMLLGLMAGSIALLIRIFFDTDLYSVQLAFLFWVWMGLIVARLRTGGKRPHES